MVPPPPRACGRRAQTPVALRARVAAQVKSEQNSDCKTWTGWSADRGTPTSTVTKVIVFLRYLTVLLNGFIELLISMFALKKRMTPTGRQQLYRFRLCGVLVCFTNLYVCFARRRFIRLTQIYEFIYGHKLFYRE